MKKILLTTSALTLLAGAAAAGNENISFGGYGYMGVTNSGAVTTISHGVRLTVAGVRTTDGGIEFGGSFRLNQVGNLAGAQQRGKVWASANGLKLVVGATNGAMKSMGRSAAYYGFNDGGIGGYDNNISTISDGGAGAINNILVTFALDSLSLAVGSISGGGTTDVGAKFSLGDATIGVGADSTGLWMGAIAYNAGSAKFSVGTNSASDIVGNMSYGMGSGTLGVAFDRSAAGTAWGVNYGHSLGGGATVSATYAVSAAGTATVGAGAFFSF